MSAKISQVSKNYKEVNLGDIFTQFVYVLLESTKLCVIIHGSGVVRAGQWARRLIMNEDLVVGTAIPEILMAMEKGYGILVMNTNDNTRYE